MALPLALLLLAVAVFFAGVSRRLPHRTGGGRVTAPLLIWSCLFIGGAAVWTWAAHVG